MNKRYSLFPFAIIVIALITTVILSGNTFADLGPKPSITVKVNNINTTDYLIDLFVNAPEEYFERMDCNCRESLPQQQLQKLYNLNYDGWISESTRWDAFLLMSDVKGNNNYTNEFTYFGVPDEYRVVIINNETGETRISDIFVRQNFDEYISINYEDMSIMAEQNIWQFMISTLVTIVLTVMIELIIAIMMKIEKWSIIVIVNIITNAILQIAFFVIPINYWVIFGIGETVVLLIELITYCALMKNENKKKIILYTFVANLTSALLTFLVYRLF